MIDKYLIACLLVISFCVAVGLMRDQNMWPLIALYWSVLSIKNLYDVIVKR